MRTSRFSFVVIVVLFALAGVANAQSAKIRINGPGEVADSGDGPKKAFFTVDLFFDYKLVECKPNNPDCNVKSVPVCVGYHTVAGSATAGEDFVAANDTLSRTVVFSEPGDEPVGLIPIDIIGDDLTEGPETFKVVLTNPADPNGPCQNHAALDVFQAQATIIDSAAPQGQPDLLVSAIRLEANCKIELTLTNAGSGPLPDSAYQPTSGAAIQLRRNGAPWGGIRLAGADPNKALKAPGGSVKHTWFPNAANLNLSNGAQTLSANIDRFNAVAESNEQNNTTVRRVFCRR